MTPYPDVPGTNDLRNVVRYGWDQVEQFEDYVDSTTMTAGHLVEETADGYQEHSTDGGIVDQVVLAKDMRGRGYDVDPTVTYADNDLITFLVCNAGVGVTLLLATGEDLSSAVPGGETRLVSNGDGTVRQFNADDPDDVIATAEEGVDAVGASDPLLIDAEVTR